MKRVVIAVIALSFTACSGVSNESANSHNSTRLSDTPQVESARLACLHRRQDEMAVGISDYEACLGERANLTRPANPQLCNLARGIMSANGVCILGE